VRDQVKAHVWDQIKAPVRAQFRAVLSNYDSPPKLNKVLKPAVHYTFLVYQLKSVTMRLAPEFRKIQASLAQFFKEQLAPEQIEAILDGLNIPSSDDFL